MLITSHKLYTVLLHSWGNTTFYWSFGTDPLRNFVTSNRIPSLILVLRAGSIYEFASFKPVTLINYGLLSPNT